MYSLDQHGHPSLSSPQISIHLSTQSHCCFGDQQCRFLDRIAPSGSPSKHLGAASNPASFVCTPEEIGQAIVPVLNEKAKDKGKPETMTSRFQGIKYDGQGHGVNCKAELAQTCVERAKRTPPVVGAISDKWVAKLALTPVPAVKKVKLAEE